MMKVAGSRSGTKPAQAAPRKKARRSSRMFPRPVRLAIMILVPIVLWIGIALAVGAIV